MVVSLWHMLWLLAVFTVSTHLCGQYTQLPTLYQLLSYIANLSTYCTRQFFSSLPVSPWMNTADLWGCEYCDYSSWLVVNTYTWGAAPFVDSCCTLLVVFFTACNMLWWANVTPNINYLYGFCLNYQVLNVWGGYCCGIWICIDN